MQAPEAPSPIDEVLLNAITEGTPAGEDLMRRLPLDVLVEIMAYLSPSEILRLCVTSSYFREHLCDADYRNIWRRLYQRDISDIPLPAAPSIVPPRGFTVLPPATYHDEYVRIMVPLKRLDQEAAIRYAAENGYEQLLLNLFQTPGIGNVITLSPAYGSLRDIRPLLSSAIQHASTFKQFHIIDRLIDFAMETLPENERRFFLNMIMPDVARSGNIDLLNKIVALGANSWLSALMGAAAGGHRAILDRAIAEGANDWDLALAHAAMGGHRDIMTYLIDRGAHDWDQVINWAAYGGHLDIVNDMIRRGATQFNRALNSAASGGHIDIIDRLVDAGATHLEAALASAAYDGQIDALEHLLDLGATDIQTALSSAAGQGHINVINRLLTFDIPASALNASLRSAARENRIGALNRLIEAGATDFNGALTHALRREQWPVVELLIRRGLVDFEAALKQVTAKNPDLANRLRTVGVFNP